MTMNPIPSPVHGDGLVFLMSGFRGNDLKAIRLADAKGNITGTSAIAWTLDRDTPYVPSPLLYDGILYFLKTNNGILSAFDAKTGKPHYQQQRLDRAPNVFSSPVGAAGRVYIPGREGTTLVFKHGPTFEVLAKNVLDDGFDASPALVDGEMYLRGIRIPLLHRGQLMNGGGHEDAWRDFVEHVVETLDVGPGTTVWDVECGAGGSCIPCGRTATWSVERTRLPRWSRRRAPPCRRGSSSSVRPRHWIPRIRGTWWWPAAAWQAWPTSMPCAAC